MRSGTTLTFSLLTLTSCLGGDGTNEQLSSVSQGARVRGAIFTTLLDGSAVNHNIYTAKIDVYLDGGPSDGSPSAAAALAEGDYYFQVTDPSGQVLLSTDAIECRRFHVGDDGVIDAVIGSCAHATGVDQDHGGLTVQLMPYADTPNPGGVYKVWATPVGAYVGGFVPSSSKLDVFKVGDLVVAPPDDDGGGGGGGGGNTCGDCGDGHVDGTEQCDDGNTVSGDGCSATCTIETTACCGNGTVEAGEQCDDDNLVSGDGCSATCQLEVSTPPGDGDWDDGSVCDNCISTVQTSEEVIFVP
jgi:cysteine-rich repeat protein